MDVWERHIKEHPCIKNAKESDVSFFVQQNGTNKWLCGSVPFVPCYGRALTVPLQPFLLYMNLALQNSYQTAILLSNIDIVKKVIEVDELDKGHKSAIAEKQDK